MNNKLNVTLSDLVVEYHKLQNFHWYAKGKDFFQVHAKLEELYDGINEAIDDVAEKMLMSNMAPVSTMKGFLESTKIKELPSEEITSDKIFTEVLADFKYFLTSFKEIKKEADAEDNYLISAMSDTYIEEFSKSIWMIQQVMK